IDANGNFVSNDVGVMSGSSLALQKIETSFHQDLNGDGVVGVSSRLLESNGTTTLYRVGDNFALGSASGPTVKYGGTSVVAGGLGRWTPLATERTTGGFEVAWKARTVDVYPVWNLDGTGNFAANDVGVISGGSWALENLESSFHQDLNGDGL